MSTQASIHCVAIQILLALGGLLVTDRHLGGPGSVQTLNRSHLPIMMAMIGSKAILAFVSA